MKVEKLIKKEGDSYYKDKYVSGNHYYPPKEREEWFDIDLYQKIDEIIAYVTDGLVEYKFYLDIESIDHEDVGTHGKIDRKVEKFLKERAKVNYDEVD